MGPRAPPWELAATAQAACLCLLGCACPSRQRALPAQPLPGGWAGFPIASATAVFSPGRVTPAPLLNPSSPRSRQGCVRMRLGGRAGPRARAACPWREPGDEGGDTQTRGRKKEHGRKRQRPRGPAQAKKQAMQQALAFRPAWGPTLRPCLMEVTFNYSKLHCRQKLASVDHVVYWGFTPNQGGPLA